MTGPDLVLVLKGVGIVLAELITAIAEAKKNKPSMFTKAFDLNTLESTLRSLEPVIRDMERLNHKMRRSKEELESLKKKMEEGTKLLNKCSKVGMFSKSSYIAELKEFDDSFHKLFNTIMAAQSARDQKEILQLQASKGFRRWLCFCCNWPQAKGATSRSC
ncbi:hypothetical protein ACSQ67_021019 [Phaseolus vulgaris]